MAKNLRTLECKCGHTLSEKEINGSLNTPLSLGYEHNFYGGRVTSMADVKCKCDREYRLYLEPKNNGKVVIDMELLKDIEEPKAEVKKEVKKTTAKK